MELKVIHAPSAPKLESQKSETSSTLQNVSQELAQVFLYEMLKSAGIGSGRDGFGGGVGEEHFSSILLKHQTKALAGARSLGIEESIFHALTKSQ